MHIVGSLMIGVTRDMRWRPRVPCNSTPSSTGGRAGAAGLTHGSTSVPILVDHATPIIQQASGVRCNKMKVAYGPVEPVPDNALGVGGIPEDTRGGTDDFFALHANASEGGTLLSKIVAKYSQ